MPCTKPQSLSIHGFRTNLMNALRVLKSTSLQSICLIPKSLQKSSCLVLFPVGPDQFNFREHGFFSNFEGSVGQKKKENKKKSPIFCVGFDYQ